MKFFIDSVDIEAIKKFTLSGMVDGVTTNPSIIAKSGKDFKQVIKEICEIVPGPVSAEVTATESGLMVEEGLILSKIAKNVTIKVPLTWDGLEACKALSDLKIMVNVTLCFSAQQALLAAKAGATFISPFIGRLDDLGEDGMDLIKDIRSIYDNYPNLKTEILAASIRSADHVRRAAIVGADISTLPPSVLSELAQHPLTDSGLKAFLDDWEKTGQKII
ncbi:fructose-6-phosphate aldolase [Hyphomicrobiales bacterium]|jgi:transaldolase|nr:fructose-6-phosphate aldolase [Hyphomicrobiales bacterium]MDA8893167.1 fructose-6-phosphate aldolase [Hyphomicrobiales bacterium]|tara:strand:+ start:511 stop:1167 length:657 start_codon:yes stop_codon:yes gene_type:complete